MYMHPVSEDRVLLLHVIRMKRLVEGEHCGQQLHEVV